MIFPTSETVQVNGVLVHGCSMDRSQTRWVLPASAKPVPGDIVVAPNGNRMEVVRVREVGGFGDAKVEIECQAWT